MARLILDTTFLIDLERNGGRGVSLPRQDDVAIASVTLAELEHGVLAADEPRRPARELFVEGVLAAVDVLPYTRATAAEHAVLLDHVRRSGTTRGVHDLIIAAHARQEGRKVVSRDVRARFGGLPGITTADPMGAPEGETG